MTPRRSAGGQGRGIAGLWANLFGGHLGSGGGTLGFWVEGLLVRATAGGMGCDGDRLCNVAVA